MSLKEEEIQVTRKIRIFVCDFCAERILEGIDSFSVDGFTRIAGVDLHNRCILTELNLLPAEDKET